VRRVAIDDDELRRLWPTGEVLDSLAKRWGCSRAAVGYRARSLGLPPRKQSIGRFPQQAIARAYTDQDMTCAEIAKLMPGLGREAVYRVLVAMGVPRRRPAKRMPGKVAECVRLFRMPTKPTLTQVAAQVGLTYHQVRHRVRSVLGPLSRGREPCVPTSTLVQMRRDGMPVADIARQVGVTRQTVGRRLSRAQGRAG